MRTTKKMVSRGAVLGVLLATVGCGGADGSPVAASPGFAAAPGTTVPSPMAGSAAPSAAPAATSSAATPATAVVETPSAFVAVAHHDGDLAVHAIGGAVLVSSHFTTDDLVGLRLGLVQNDAIRWQDGLVIPGYFHQLVAVVGTWPDRLDVLATGSTGRTGVAEHWTIRDGRLVQGRSEVGQVFVGMSQVGGGLLALSRPAMFGAPVFHTLRAPARRYPFTPVSSECAKQGFGRSTEVIPAAFAGMADGTLVSVGMGCEHDVAAEIWERGRKPRVMVVPVDGDTLGDMEGQLLPGKGKELWFASGQLAHFDGASWRAIATPNDLPVSAADVAPDGTLWVTSGSTVFRRDGERWTELALPAQATVDSFAVDDEGVAWVASGGTLLRHGGGAPAQQVVMRGRSGPERVQPKLPRPGSSQCAANLVVLYGFTKVTPDDYDFPMTREAVAGHWELKGTRFFVTRDLGEKFFVAKPPSFDVAVKLQKLVAEKVPGSKPQIVCTEPEVVREVKIDLATGAVKK